MTPTPPQEQTEREAFEAALAHITGCALDLRDFAWLMWRAGRASMQAQAPRSAEPLTESQIKDEHLRPCYCSDLTYDWFEAGVRFAERHHGIDGGKQ